MKYRALQDRIPPRSLSEESEVVIFHHPSPLRGVMHPCDVASPEWACEPEMDFTHCDIITRRNCSTVDMPPGGHGGKTQLDFVDGKKKFVRN